MPGKVLITGGGKRIGAALAKAFAQNNWQLTLHVNNSLAEAQELIGTLKNPHWHQITQCDFSDQTRRREWMQTLGEFDLIICNASCYRLTRRNETETPENRQRYWQVNYHAVLELIEQQYAHLPPALPAAALVMLDCEVLTDSGGIKEFTAPPPGVDSYLASRIALARRLPELARAFAPRLRINAVAPGPVLPPADCTTGGMTVILDRVPMHQPVPVQDIVNTALYLAQAPSVTGSIIAVDGGMHLGVK